jgi:branched-chain amino acid transport system substrate-binding protein
VGQFLKQSKEMGFKPNFFSSISFEDPKVVEIAGDAANGVIYTAYNYDASIDSGIVGRFNLNYEKKYNKRPNIYSALGYDAAYVLFYVLDKAYPETDKLNSELSSVKIEKTITSKISFDENGDVKQGITLKKYLNGKYYFLTKNL